MIPNIVGPPIAGTTDLKAFSLKEKSPEKNFKESGADSFGKELEEKMSSGAPSRDAREAKGTRERPEVSQGNRESPSADRPSGLEAKSEKEVVKQNGIAGKKAVPSRQQAIKEFMDSFESEFEIPPTRLVEAMAALDETQITQAPEATAEAVIAQLGLSEEDAEKAQAMYAGLLTQLAQTPAPVKVAPLPAVMARSAVSPQDVQMRFISAQQKQSVMDASVDRLNNRFWMKDAMSRAPATPVLEKFDGDLASRIMMETETPLEVNLQGPLPEPLPEGQLPEIQVPMKDAVAPETVAKQAVEASASTDGLSQEDLQVLEAFEGPPQVKQGDRPVLTTAAAMTGKAAYDFSQQQQQGQSQTQMENSRDFFKGMTSEKETAKNKLMAKATEFKQAMTGLEGLHATTPKLEALKLEQALPLASTGPSTPTNPADNEATVKSLMNQAQYLVKKGGGEVKVQMTPEGLGTIHMKMQLQDGKVNLQMSADTHEAKKTIESGLAELKTSLAAHKLSVDHVKIDVVSSASADTATQNNNNMNGNGHREARQFWNQFNENFGSQGRRESYLQEGQNLKGYGPRRKDPLQPIEASNVQRKIEGKGGGLNLVA